MVSGQAAQRHPAGPAVDVQDFGELAVTRPMLA
jgi:hypothetical protein